LNYLDNLRGGGGTMMMEGIRRSLDFPHDESRLRFVTFLTDGYIGNEVEILSALRRSLGPSRVFSFGVGSSTNRYLLDSMAKLGNGAAAYLGLNDDGEKVMADYFERISHPALTDLQIDFGGASVSETYPRSVPDLFVGRPVIVTGRFKGEMPREVRLVGKAGGEAQSFAITVANDAATLEHSGIANVWARMKIGDIADRSIYDESFAREAPAQIRQVALEYGVMSAFTSFLAVDSTQRTSGDHGTTVATPVPVPEGVRYETTVPEH
jgi:Ca-activated chloride channel family protein